MKIVVTGSLGHISKPLAEELVQKGHEVTVISSSADRKQAIEALGATAAIGSVEDPDFLTSTFTGADAVYCMVPPDFRQPDPIAYYVKVGNSYAAAIQAAGVKRVVELSSYGAHLERGTGLIVGSYRNEQIFNALPEVVVTHMRPGYFMYNLLMQIPVIQAAGMMAANYGGEDRLPLVSPKDIAAAVADEITRPATGMQVRYVQSDERTCSEVAHLLGEAIGKPDLQWITLSDADMQANLEKSGMPPAITTMLVELNAAIHNGTLREDIDKHQVPLGRVKLEDYVPEFAAAYQRGSGGGH
jgi:uncharacterized protein YbjT (DUF2867 family)